MRDSVDAQDAGDLRAMLGVREVVAAEQVRRVAEQPRAHRVALAGDRVRAGARPADVAGHQRQVDDRLRGADALVALVDAHRPPERDALAVVNQLGESLDLLRASVPCRAATRSERDTPATNAANSSKPVVCVVDVRRVDPAAFDQRSGRRRRAAPGRTSARAADAASRAIAVSVLPRIDDDDLGLVRLRSTRSHMIGCAMHRLLPIEHDARRTPRSRRRCTAARRSRTTACTRRRTWPCTAACCRRRAACPCRTSPARRATPSPRSASAGAEERHDCAAVLRLDRLEAGTNVSQRRRPSPRAAARRSRCAAAASWRGRAHSEPCSASQPFGHAMPRLTGILGVRRQARPPRRRADGQSRRSRSSSSRRPCCVVASGLSRAGTCPAEPAGLAAAVRASADRASLQQVQMPTESMDSQRMR